MKKRILEDLGFAGAITAMVAVLVYLPPAVSTVQAETVQNVLFVEADSVRSQRGIVGYELSITPEDRLRISVVSQHRAADIYIDPSTAAALSTITVNVAATGETLVATTDADLGGIASINGNPVASWEFDGEDWSFSGIEQLSTFTSWNILSDTLEDEGMEGALLLAVFSWVSIAIGIITILVAAAVGVWTISLMRKTLRGQNAGASAAHIAACAKAANDCEIANYAPDNGQCIFWFTQCQDVGLYEDWCCALDLKCKNADYAACDLAAAHCPEELFPPENCPQPIEGW